MNGEKSEMSRRTIFLSLRVRSIIAKMKSEVTIWKAKLSLVLGTSSELKRYSSAPKQYRIIPVTSLYAKSPEGKTTR